MMLKKCLLGSAMLVLLVFSGQAFCQSNSSIGGSVTDATGGVLPGASITVPNSLPALLRRQ